MCLSLPPTGGRGRWGDDEEDGRRERERERELGGPTAPWACGRDGAESACGLLQAAKRACTVSFPGAVGDPRRRTGRLSPSEKPSTTKRACAGQRKVGSLPHYSGARHRGEEAPSSQHLAGSGNCPRSQPQAK
ncbi:unnamed protein product [Prorocentrum cordatum]|uniref:Uncharacterized protein n=1 Tax=Prorocentrum cordatum TaxID=2364126 RepID=A0ABN9WEJ6_9DINO|nr:unnamed protein product [Polarella glacialis]